MLAETMYKGVGTRLELTTLSPKHACRVGQGTTITLQYDIPEGFKVNVSGTVASHREIPDATANEAKMRSKGILADFTHLDTMTGKGIVTLTPIALNGLLFELVSMDAETPGDTTDDVSFPTEDVEPSALEWPALRNLAKSLGVNTLGMKREDVEEAVTNAITAMTNSESATPKATSVPVAGVISASVAFTCK